MNIFTKFHKDWTRIVDFLLIAKFLASANNFVTPSSCVQIISFFFILKDTYHCFKEYY